MFTVEVKCPKHPRYKAILPPRCGCHRCEKMYACRKALERIADAGHSWFPVATP